MNCPALVLQAWSNPQRPTPSWGPHRTAHTPQINAAVLWPQGCRPLQPRASRVHPTTLPTGFSALPVLRNLGQRRHGKHPFFALSPCTRRTCKVHLARGESFLVAERRRAGDFVPWQGRLPAAVEDLPTAYFSSLPAHPPTPSRFQPLRGPGVGRAHLSRNTLQAVLPRTAIWSDLPHRWTSFCCQSAMSLSFSHIERSTLQYSVHKVAPRQ